jgi:anaerobic selenocysteine-containing dehydrogenase
LSAFGSPNDISLDRGEEASSLALSYSQGVHSPPSYDLQSTDYVLSFGSALLEASSSPVHMMRAYGEFRQGRPGRRGKLVQIESRLSLTGSSADEWISVRPGSEGVLALGLAHVLVSEGLYDRDFVSFRTHGVGPYRDGSGNLREGLKSFLEENYYLERVANQTDVPVSVILRLAREFAAARSRLAVGPRRGPLLPGRLFDHLAVQVLNALAGNLDAPGGVLVPEDTPIADLPALPADPRAQEGLARPRLDRVDGSDTQLKSDPESFAEALERGAAYPLEVLFVLAADPVFASFSPTVFAEALQKVPLIVSCTPLANDTSLLADFILPEAHFLESWELDTTPPGIPYPVVSLARPAIEKPRGEARPVGEILAALAKLVGGEVETTFAWSDLTDLLRHEVEGLFEARRGTIMGTPFDEAWVRMMERAGWWAPGYRSADELWKRMQDTGGWWDPFYDHGDWRRVLNTESGKFEFRTDVLAKTSAQRTASMSRRRSLDRSEGPAGGEPGGQERLLTLLLFEPLPIAGGTGAELPFLQELLDPGLEERWETWAEIHPETAARLGIRDHEWAQVTSEQGSIEVRARVTPRVVEGAVAIPVGLGKRAGGRWAAGRGANPLTLLKAEREPVSGLPDPSTTQVRLTRLRRGHRQTERRS